jgi:hypothetical protein
MNQEMKIYIGELKQLVEKGEDQERLSKELDEKPKNE